MAAPQNKELPLSGENLDQAAEPAGLGKNLNPKLSKMLKCFSLLSYWRKVPKANFLVNGVAKTGCLSSLTAQGAAFSADGAPPVLRGRGYGFADSAGEKLGGMSGSGTRQVPATQVPDPGPVVRSTNGRVPHRPGPRPFLPGSVSGAAVAQRHPGRPHALLCQWENT